MSVRVRKKPRPRDYSEYLRGDAWRRVRARVLRRDGHRCVICDRPAVHVHHRHYHGTGEEKERDLLSLCAGCHEWVHMNDVDLPRVKKGTGKRAQSLRHLRRAAIAAGHPRVAPVALASEHVVRNRERR